ncbi:MAG TPA: hypothetical protein VFP10_11930, partial [Candidatus Eisenbacteria bacterium]|nr:hypothetical protein [Candidatus Eisenbacteria bacterium]
GVYRPASAVMGDLDQAAQLQTMNQGVANRESFLVPTDGTITADQLARFSRVQTGIRTGLGTEYPLLEERAQRLKGLTATKDGELRARRLGVRDAVTAFDGLGPVLRRAKEIQVNALNVERFSVAEYRWVREHFYRSLGFTRTNVYFEDFAAELKQRKPLQVPSEEGLPPEPERNQDLAAVYSDSVRSWFPLLVFGL